MVNIPCTSSATTELGAGLWETSLEMGGWATGCTAMGGLWGFESVARAATAGVDVRARLWVWLGDLILRWHAWGIVWRWWQSSSY